MSTSSLIALKCYFSPLIIQPQIYGQCAIQCSPPHACLIQDSGNDHSMVFDDFFPFTIATFIYLAVSITKC